VVLLSLLLRVSEFAHFLLVEHVVCRDHGELLHVDDAEQHASKAATDLDVVPTLREAAAEHGGHEHDHCTWFSEHREALVADRSGVESPEPLPSSSVATRACASSRLCAIPLLLLAPKGSPPA